uniref:CUB domain-containing protein n=1 Tax=Glossina palpalis gambiensis TaxID=67801 RepID=A0A1B0BRK8_9MUSC
MKGGGGASDVTKDQCNKTVDIFEDVSSPELTNQNVGRPLICWYRFRTLKGAPRDFIVDGNAKTDVSNRREPGMFCGEAEQPQTFISETSYVKVLFHTDNFTDQVSFRTTSFIINNEVTPPSSQQRLLRRVANVCGNQAAVLNPNA